MTLEEFKQIVDFYSKQVDSSEITVKIPVYKLGVFGHRPCVDLKSAVLGFDWEAKSFLLISNVELREIDCDEIKALREKYQELSWSKYKINKIVCENKQLKEQLQKVNKSSE